MPKTTKSGEPIPDELPSTIQRSGDKAQRTFAKTHDAAVDTYGEGERANRTAFSALKHTHEKIGDHWEKKAKKGPSDDRAAAGGRGAGRAEEGVDANASKKHLYDVAKRLGVEGRSTMDKQQLVEAIKKANRRSTSRARTNRL